MKSVGEVMAIGRTFKESFQKGLRGLEIKAAGFESKKATGDLTEHLVRPNAERVFYLKRAIEEGMELKKIHELTQIDPWFLENLFEIVEFEKELKALEEMIEGGFGFHGTRGGNVVQWINRLNIDKIKRKAGIIKNALH